MINTEDCNHEYAPTKSYDGSNRYECPKCGDRATTCTHKIKFDEHGSAVGVESWNCGNPEVCGSRLLLQHQTPGSDDCHHLWAVFDERPVGGHVFEQCIRCDARRSLQ